MNPYALNNTARLRQFAEALLESVEVAEHNARLEKEITERPKDSPIGTVHSGFYKKPRYHIHNLHILAQITDNQNHSVLEHETYHIKEGGVVEFSDDGTVTEVEDFKNIGGVHCL